MQHNTLSNSYRFAVALVLALLAISPVAVDAKTGQDLMQKASASFSHFTFNTPLSKISRYLDIIKENECEEWGECSYRDRNGVEHYFFFEEQLLVLKIIDEKQFKNKPIPAFGLGLARDKSKVLKTVGRFLEDTKPHCYQQNEHGPGLACEFYIGEGWTKLFFNSDDRLVFIRLDAYHFT